MDYILLFTNVNENYYYSFEDGMIYAISIKSDERTIQKWSMIGAIVGVILYSIIGRIKIVVEGGFITMMWLCCIGAFWGWIIGMAIRKNAKKTFCDENRVDTTIEYVEYLLLQGEKIYKKRRNLRIGMFIFSIIGTLILATNSINIFVVICIIICWSLAFLLLTVERPILYRKLKRSLEKGYLLKTGGN